MSRSGGRSATFVRRSGWRARGRRTVGRDASSGATSALRRHLSRDRPRQPARADLPRRPRLRPTPRVPRRRRRALPVALPRVLPDAEPLPPRDPNSRREHLGRHAEAERRVRPVVQPAPRSHRPRLSGPLPRRDRAERSPPAGALPLPPAQPCPRAALSPPQRLAVEQLPRRELERAAAVVLDRQLAPRLVRHGAGPGAGGLPELRGGSDAERPPTVTVSDLPRGLTPGRGPTAQD